MDEDGDGPRKNVREQEVNRMIRHAVITQLLAERRREEAEEETRLDAYTAVYYLPVVVIGLAILMYLIKDFLSNLGS